MRLLTVDHVRIRGISACLPSHSEDNLSRCRALYGDEKKAVSVVKATGITSRRVAEPGTTSLDLTVAAARDILADTRTKPEEIGALVSVTFTPARAMPCNACQAQSRLGLGTDTVVFDMGLACSGWAYGLYTAALYVKATGKSALLLDGDVQTPRVAPTDQATVPVLADAGTATLLEPDAHAAPWTFAFLSDGAKGEALQLPGDGTIAMDGFAVFKFVTMDVLNFVRAFLDATHLTADRIDAFAPHQANIFMIRQIARKLGLEQKLLVSGDVFGNSASATVPTTIAARGAEALSARDRDCRLLVSGFGGGLSASVGCISLPPDCRLKAFDYAGN